MKEELEICLKNSEEQLKHRNCEHREFMAGECSGLQLILDLCETLKDVRDVE